VWWAWINLEVITFSALGIGALNLRIEVASLDDGALGVVDDHPLGHTGKPIKRTAVAAQPGGHRLVPDEFHWS